MEMFWYLLAFVWGGIVALFLQFTHLGQFLAIKRTWITVIVGVGVDLGIALGLLYTIQLQDALTVWLQLIAIFGLSSLGVIIRSLVNEQREIEREITEAKRGR